MRCFAASLALFLCLAAAAHAAEPAKLPSCAAAAGQTSVSGVSSGAAMAIQFGTAHASEVAGIGAIAAPPFACADKSADEAVGTCMCAVKPVDPATLRQRLTTLKADLDPPRAGQKVWMFTGGQDETVKSQNTRLAAEAMLNPGEQLSEETWTAAGPQTRCAPDARVCLVSHAEAVHAHIVEVPNAHAAGLRNCGEAGAPYISDCDLPAAEVMLERFHGRPQRHSDSGSLISFDQRPFIKKQSVYRGFSFADTGYVYVPKACEAGGCPVHVVFHGCRMTDAEVYFRNDDYNRWAREQGVIILYPRVEPSGLTSYFRQGEEGKTCQSYRDYPGWSSFVLGLSRFENPNGCWDWWGYNGEHFADREAPQIKVVMAMLRHLTGQEKLPAAAPDCRMP